ncbi:MAG: exo-alpha-sialidase, partial [Thermoguttaceae bacterium]|nr:exo-alpha-sialidase [Thermoguttaceae bacterium]
GANVFVSTDQGKTFSRLGIARVPQNAYVFDEHNLIEKKDASIWLLARTRYGIGESFSFDHGKTWTEVAPSKTLKHCSSRFFIRRLQSGNLLLVKNGPADRDVGRSQLTAMISKDDGKTWSSGLVLDERSGVSYPDGNQAPDGTIYVTYDYSRYDAKEICVARFTESDVNAGKIITPSSQLNLIANKATGKRIRILSYNVCNTKGMDDKRDAQRVADVIIKARPDVVAIQELDRCTKRSQGVDVLADLAKRTKMIGTYGPAIEFQGGHYGIGMLSKEKPVSFKTVPLPGKEEKRCLLVVEFADFVMCCTHFSLTPEDRLTSAQLICQELAKWKKPVFVAGDFNATPDSIPVQTMQKQWATLSSDELTWSSVKPDRRIDYIFGAWSNKVACDAPVWRQSILKASVIDEKLASDHRPIFVDFNLGLLKGNAR